NGGWTLEHERHHDNERIVRQGVEERRIGEDQFVVLESTEVCGWAVPPPTEESVISRGCDGKHYERHKNNESGPREERDLAVKFPVQRAPTARGLRGSTAPGRCGGLRR